MRKRKRPAHSIHRGLDYHRVEQDRANHPDGTLEMAMADMWEEANTPQAGVNGGRGILDNLTLGRSEWPGAPQRRLILTRRDAAIAATAVQWLGTNVGSSYLREAFARVNEPLPQKKYERLIKHVEHDRRRLEEQRHELNLRKQKLDERETDLNKRAEMLATNVELLRQREIGFVAMMMLADVRIFRRSEPKQQGKRRIQLREGE